MAVMPPAYFKGDEMIEIVFMFFRSRMGSQPLAGGQVCPKRHHRKLDNNGRILEGCQHWAWKAFIATPLPLFPPSASQRLCVMNNSPIEFL